MSRLHNITLSCSMIKVKSQREKETWQMIPQSSPSPSWAALQHNMVINLFPGEKIILKTFQRYRGQHKNLPNILKTFQRYQGPPEVSQPSRILGAAWEKKRSTLKYIFDLCLHGETIWWSDDQRYILLLICLLTWGNHLRGQHQHQVPPGWGAQSWGSGRRGGEQSQPRAQGFAGKHIFL